MWKSIAQRRWSSLLNIGEFFFDSNGFMFCMSTCSITSRYVPPLHLLFVHTHSRLDDIVFGIAGALAMTTPGGGAGGCGPDGGEMVVSTFWHMALPGKNMRYW